MDAGAVAAAYALSALTAAALTVLSLRHRRTAPTAAPALATVTVGLAWWATADLLLALDPGAPYAEAVLLTLFPAATLVVAGFYCLARALADRDWRPGRRLLAALAVEPAVVVAACVTEPLHGSFVTAVQPRADGSWLDWEPGPLFWAHTGYSYVLLGIGAAVLVRAWRHAGRLHRRQLALVLAAAVVPFVGNVVSLSPALRPVLPDLTAVFFSITASIDAYAIFRVGLMTLVPIARGQVLNRLTDAVVVVDADGRLLDVNAAGVRLLRRLVPDLPSSLAGLPAEQVARRYDIPTPLRDGEYVLDVDGEQVVLDVRASALTDARGEAIGSAVVMRDVSAVHAQRVALARANEQLRLQLATIDGLRHDLAEQAVRDPLTGLHNRRFLVEALDRALATATARGADLSVVLLDIDHFKSVNDTHGHAVGDTVLVATARLLAEAVREGDTLARYGGEEFVVILPGASGEQARARAEEWRERCARLLVEGRTGPVSRTISVGVASVAVTGPDAAALLQAADEALYAAKAAGRDRVVVAG